MDEIARYNQARWKALVEAAALFTRPNLNLDVASARQRIDPDGKLGDVKGRDVLCLAGGGGQQSGAFALLGANVTVFDLSDEQLEQDKKVAEHFGFEIKIVQGDMRNLSCFDESSFDIVYHAYSLSFVTDAEEVFRQVARVLRNGGTYWFGCANPFVMGMSQNDWNGDGYLLKKPYLSKARITYEDQDWVYNRDRQNTVPSPIEYRHTLSDLVNGLTNSGFVIFHLYDDTDMHADADAEPGTWDHFVAYAPPWLNFLAVYKPDFKVE
jgi:ubiquinone/menaquinone biosynthesis C-methylase UbiE